MFFAVVAVNGNRSQINPAYNDVDSMTAALTKLGQDDPKYQVLPITWIRVMHPKGSGYAVMSDAVIDSVLQFGPQGAAASPSQSPIPSPTSTPAPSPTEAIACAAGNNKFLARDDLSDKINQFCADAAKQGVQDPGSGSTLRKYNTGSRYEVDLSMDWPPGVDIKNHMQENCVGYMTDIMDSKSLS